VTIKSRVTGKIWITSSYDDWRSHTVEVNFAPKTTSASVAMCGFYYPSEGGGEFAIESFEYRDTPSGPNRKVHSPFGNWPASVYHTLMTRVTFFIGTYGGTYVGNWTIDFWR